MEYGYEIVDAAGNRQFFVEGCTYCQMSTGGQHNLDCPLKESEGTYAELGVRLKTEIDNHPERGQKLL